MMDSEQFQQFQQLPQAPFPAPPPFWQHFTVENLERVRGVHDDSPMPYKLNLLRPPASPTLDADSYMTFGIPQKLDPTPALPPPEILLFNPSSPAFNHATVLRQLTKSLLLNFLELTTVLGNDPVHYEEKMQHIERLMLNVHFVINLYRPHQARESIKDMLQARLDQGRREMEQCDMVKERAEKFLNKIGHLSKPELGVESVSHGNEEIEDEQKLWNLIHSIGDQ